VRCGVVWRHCYEALKCADRRLPVFCAALQAAEIAPGLAKSLFAGARKGAACAVKIANSKEPRAKTIECARVLRGCGLDPSEMKARGGKILGSGRDEAQHKQRPGVIWRNEEERPGLTFSGREVAPRESGGCVLSQLQCVGVRRFRGCGRHGRQPMK